MSDQSRKYDDYNLILILIIVFTLFHNNKESSSLNTNNFARSFELIPTTNRSLYEILL